MNTRMISKMIVVAGMFWFLVWCGVSAAKWADATSKQTEANFADAFKVLQDN